MSFRLWYCGYAYSCVWNYSWAFLTISIYAHYYGVLFAGEANAGYHTDLYNCTFPAMVADWRQNFYQGSGGHNERIFPFGFVQVQPGCGQWHVIEIWKIADIKFELQFRIEVIIQVYSVHGYIKVFNNTSTVTDSVCSEAPSTQASGIPHNDVCLYTLVHVDNVFTSTG